jgi:L-asparaginase II
MDEDKRTSEALPGWLPVARRMRGTHVECVHYGGAVALDAGGKLLFAHGDPGEETYFRSSVKCWQALPLVESGAADRYGFTPAELALACASHEGEAMHVATAASMLAKIGLTAGDLRCGAHAPYDRNAAQALVRAGDSPSTLHNNCSGKHSGMLACCLHHGWTTADYPAPGHPLQRAIRERIAAAAGLPADLPYATDGCGVPTFFMPISGMARMFSSLGAAPADTALGRLGNAMRAHPELVAGPRIFDTRLAQATGGRVIAKRGGAALGCAATRDGIGIVVKCGDGTKDVVPAMLMRMLAKLDLLSAAEQAALADFAAPVQKNVAGLAIGRLEACF